MRRQVRGLTQAAANAQDGISVVQTAEGALNEVEDMLQRMNELAVKGENGTLTTTERSSIQSEIKQLMSEVDRVQSTTTFNEMNLLDGKFIKGLQVGAEAGQHIDISIRNMSMAGLASKVGTLYDPVKFSALTEEDAKYDKTTYDKDATSGAVIGTVDSGTTKSYAAALAGEETTLDKDFNSLNAFIKGAITLVSMQRSDLGAIQNRLEHTINNLNNITENTQSAEAAIRDTDIATEMVQFSNNNILQQAGTSMLSQANQGNQLALSLLG